MKSAWAEPAASRAARGLGLLAAFLGGLGLALHMQAQAGPSTAAVWVYAAALLCAAAGMVASRRWVASQPSAAAPDPAAAAAFLAPLVLYLVSYAARRTDFFLIRWLPGPGQALPLERWGLARFAALAVLLTPVFFRRLRRTWLLLLAVMLASQIACARALWRETAGVALYSDDHPSFLLRFWTFARSFPQYAYYDPFWNGGRAAPYIVGSGAVPQGLLFWPLWRYLPAEQIYTPIVAFSFIGLLPLMAAGAARLSGGSRTAAFCAGTLALSSGRPFFLWALHFGTVGSTFCLAWLPLILAALYRILWLERREWWTGLVLVVSAFFFLTWPPAGLLTLPVLGAVLLSARAWSARKLLFLAACGGALLALYLPFFLAVVGIADPASFAQPAGPRLVLSEAWRVGWRQLGDSLRGGNPLVVFLGVAGCVLMRRTGFRLFFATALLGLVLFAGWGEKVLPQIPFTRTILPLLFAATIPAALMAADLLESGPRGLAPVRAGLLALLILGADSAVRYYRSPVHLPYHTLRQDVLDLVTWIQDHTPSNGRILFAGPTVHAYGGGHVAYLPVLTGREMMACDYYHFSPARVEYNYPPRAFRKEDDDVYDFLDLYNVTHVITSHGSWIRFFKRHVDLYERVMEFPGGRKKLVYRVRRDPSFFLEGSGQVQSGINELRVRLDRPAERVVLKYNWADGLSADPPVELAPYDMGRGVRLIAARPNGALDFTIRYRWSPWACGLLRNPHTRSKPAPAAGADPDLRRRGFPPRQEAGCLLYDNADEPSSLVRKKQDAQDIAATAR